MGDFRERQEVWVLCDAQSEPFPDERLVTIKSTDGPISGFVKTNYLEQPNSRTTRVRGRITRRTGRRHKGSHFRIIFHHRLWNRLGAAQSAGGLIKPMAKGYGFIPPRN
jgi:hypothetical protein